MCHIHTDAHAHTHTHERIKSELFSIYFNVLLSHMNGKNENKEMVKSFAERENGTIKMYDFEKGCQVCMRMCVWGFI